MEGRQKANKNLNVEISTRGKSTIETENKVMNKEGTGLFGDQERPVQGSGILTAFSVTSKPAV